MDIIIPEWDVPGNVMALVSLREGGVSVPPYDSMNLADHVGDAAAAVSANRERLTRQLPDVGSLQWLRQVHSARVERLVSAGDPLEADGLISRVPGVACCVLTADCLPVFLCAADGAEVGLLHAGWRGLSAGIVERGVAAMSTPPDRIRAWLGPAIGPCHFEIGEEVRAVLLHGDDSLPDACWRSAPEPGKFFTDLYAIARHKLKKLGVSEVTGGEACTYCDSQRFFSYRRDGETGRIVNLIYLRDSKRGPA